MPIPAPPQVAQAAAAPSSSPASDALRAADGSVATITGDWTLTVSAPGGGGSRSETIITVAPSDRVMVAGERYDALKPWDDKLPPWQKGTRLAGPTTFETTMPDALEPDSLRVRSGSGAEAPLLTLGVDYQREPRWAAVGSLPGGKAVGVPVWLEYGYGRGRMDSVVRTAGGSIALHPGVPDIACPLPPPLAPGETRLFNVYLRPRAPKLTPDDVFPITETTPTFAHGATPYAQTHLPKTWAALTHPTAGRPLRILAWGDSVTAGGQASDAAHQYQEQFVARLRRRFPTANIELTTVAWPGRTSAAFLAEPPGSPYNFQEKILDARPDLVTMEFVNDAGLSPAQVEERYASLLARLREIGAEYVILTPHFVWGEWMGTGAAKVTHDPRPYVAGLRAFAARHETEPGFALADASRGWEHLAAEGIPYQTLLKNSLNHPDNRGYALFADALMALFEGP